MKKNLLWDHLVTFFLFPRYISLKDIHNVTYRGSTIILKEWPQFWKIEIFVSHSSGPSWNEISNLFLSFLMDSAVMALNYLQSQLNFNVAIHIRIKQYVITRYSQYAINQFK